MAKEMMPQRGSLVAECVRVMRMRIEAGEWRDFLPGERRLAEVLQVGRDTIRLMLLELEAEGWIEPPQAGCRRRLTAEHRRQEGSLARGLSIGMLSPQRLERLNQPMLLEVDHIRRALAEKGGSFEVFSPGWFESKKPGRRLAELIEGERRAAWILHRSTRTVQRWFENNRVPSLVRGTPHEDVTLPFLDVDWQATARHAAGLLWRLGHRRVAILTPPDRLRGVEAAVRGAAEIREPGFQVIELAENGTAGGIERIFNRALGLKDPPTAFIALRPRQVASLLGCAAKAGLRVPDHVSLVSLAREQFLEFLVPEVTGYRSDPAVVARQVVRRLEQMVSGNVSPGGNPWLVTEVVKGGSVGAPGLA